MTDIKTDLQLQLRTVTARRRLPTARVILALMLREMASSSGKAWGGYMWSVAEPVGGILLLTIIFSLAFRAPPVGDSFALFYATGLMPFMFYMAVQGRMAQALNFSRPLLAYPAVTFTDALIARALVVVTTETLVSGLVFGYLFLTVDTRTSPNLGGMGLSFLMAFVLGCGIGIFNAFLFPTFPVWEKIWSILNRPLLIISCVLFVYDTMSTNIRTLLWWNPLVHIVGQMRKAVYVGYSGNYVSLIYVFGTGLLLMVIGLALLMRYHRTILNER